MIKSLTSLLIVTLTTLSSFANSSDPSVVEQIDLQKYSGFWYQVAHTPSFFLNSCAYSIAEYGIISETAVSVINTCYKNDGSTSNIKGTASVVDPATPAKLKVEFNIFAKGDYWVTDLDPNYEWAVVSGPGKKSIFILSRTAPMSKSLLDSIVNQLKQKGFDTDKLIYDAYND